MRNRGVSSPMPFLLIPRSLLRGGFIFLAYANAEKALQLQHRMTLVNLWRPGLGAHIMEVGCGQGETTVALAAAVGASGRVLAVDNAQAEYGRPVTLGQAHAYILRIDTMNRQALANQS